MGWCADCIVALTETLRSQCVFDVNRKEGGLTLTELAPGVTLEEVQKKTGAPFKVAEDLKQMEA